MMLFKLARQLLCSDLTDTQYEEFTMKKLAVIAAGLFLTLSAGLVQASDSDNAESDNYIPWTWDDIKD